MIRALGYASVPAKNIADWVSFGSKLLGLQVASQDRASASFRMDDRPHRLTVRTEAAPPLFGWEVGDAAALDALASRLEENKVAVSRVPTAVAAARGVKDAIAFADPAGNRLEAYHGAASAADPFQPGRTISGFVTGGLGMGHVVLTVAQLQPVMAFYRDVLGFRLSDYVLNPFKAYFFHCNARHHSLAMLETGKNGIHHLMVELYSLDDVGQGYDLALGEQGRIATTLGRHTNDFVTSFYAFTPSDFMLEYGWGGRHVDDATWQAVEVKDGPSLWGHERAWLPEEGRQQARRMRLDLAQRGVRQPVQVMPGNHQPNAKP